MGGWRRLVGVLTLAGLIAGWWGGAHADDPAVTILVTSNGWHTGLVIERDRIPAGLIPETGDFTPDMRWFEFGWGSADYYPVRDPGPLDAVRAASGGAAVMHVVGLAIPAGAMFPTLDVVPVRLDSGQFVRLLARIDAAFDRGGVAGRPGLYAFSRFYPAHGRFHLFHTCNSWTAETLAAAGLPVEPSGVRRAEDLMRQIR
jgi:uncharacterized protein (TIGR02117 family)